MLATQMHPPMTQGRGRVLSERANPVPHNKGKSKYGVPRRLPDGRGNPEWYRQQRLLNPEMCRAKARRWEQKNREHVRAKNREWSARHPEKRRELSRRYTLAHQEQERARHRLYQRTHREAIKARHRLSVKYRLYRLRQKARRRRSLPTTTILGSQFQGSVLHHMTPDVAVHIPGALHTSIWHSIPKGINMERINPLAMAFYESCDRGVLR